MISKERLQEIEKRCNSATGSKWFNGYWIGQCHIKHIHGNGHCVYDPVRYEKKNYVASENGNNLIGSDEFDDILSEADALFIANAKQDIPCLVAAVRELQAQVDFHVDNFNLQVALSKEQIKESQSQVDRQWIPVSERLPEDDTLVLVTNGGLFGLRSLYSDDYKYWWDETRGESERFDKWTHWMPLPESPNM
ncbi:MAG: DUF551 domain-containing protein [Sporomusaceae bacterium]|nr:DUF551 domain-containing protein [Sporomusaceae bacterium]